MSRCQGCQNYLLDIGFLCGNSYENRCMCGVCGNWYVCLCPEYWIFCLCDEVCVRVVVRFGGSSSFLLGGCLFES